MTARQLTAAAFRRAAARPRLPNAPLLRLIAALLLLTLLLPALSVIGKAAFGEAGVFWSRAALFYSLAQTAAYVGGVVLLSLIFALPAAWVTTAFAFRGRRLLSWMLFLPFAVPPYINGYVAADILRAFGMPAHGLPPACLATALSLYPYIYFLTRMALRRQHCHIQSAARLLGCSSPAAFWRVSLPMARPAVVVGVALTAMESLNDIAVAEYFGVHTLGIGVYDLWLNRGDLVGAARLAVLLMLSVFFLVWLEERNRRRQHQYTVVCDRCYECERVVTLSRARLMPLLFLLLLPSLAGFWLPAGRLAFLSAQTPAELWRESLLGGLGGSLLLAFSMTAFLLLAGFVFAAERRCNKSGAFFALLSRLAYVVYAMPGTILAQGVFIFVIASASWGAPPLLQIGGFSLLLLACSARFFLISGGAMAAAMDAVSPQLDAAAKLAAMRPLRTFFTIHLPLLRPAAAMAAVMIFLEGIKELPMTLLLRPLNFDTLATIVYQYASDEALALAAPSALCLSLLAALAVSTLFIFEGRDTRGVF